MFVLGMFFCLPWYGNVNKFHLIIFLPKGLIFAIIIFYSHTSFASIFNTLSNQLYYAMFQLTITRQIFNKAIGT